MLIRSHQIERELVRRGIPRGAVVSLETSFSPNAVAFIIALACQKHICVPLIPRDEKIQETLREGAQVEWIVSFNKDDQWEIRRRQCEASHALVSRLKAEDRPGLVLFTSGSTGKPKAIIHDLEKLTNKYLPEGKSLPTVGLLLFDHIGGLDTLFYNLFNCSTLAIPASTKPEAVCEVIQQSKAQVLPAAPSFLNLLFASGANKTYDLSSLKIITFGSEVMPANLLAKLQEEFPQVKLIQKYGMSELGTLQTKSNAADSTQVKLEGRSMQVRVVDGLLELKTDFSFLGYLNSDENPFTTDGWYQTGDMVEVSGDYYKIKGRQKHMVNVGGEKVNPVEVEEVIAELPEIENVVVSGEANAFLGNILVARINVRGEYQKKELEKQLLAHCRARMPKYKVPQKIVFEAKTLVSERMKKTG